MFQAPVLDTVVVEYRLHLSVLGLFRVSIFEGDGFSVNSILCSGLQEGFRTVVYNIEGAGAHVM